MINTWPSPFTKNPVDASAVSSMFANAPASIYPEVAFILILPADNWFALIDHPPTVPPVNKTFEPVICPLDFNVKLSLVELICVDANSNPPIVPPVNNTLDPVMSPDAFTLN